MKPHLCSTAKSKARVRKARVGTVHLALLDALAVARLPRLLRLEAQKFKLVPLYGLERATREGKMCGRVCSSL